MVRYIDADELIAKLKKQYGEDWQCTVNLSDIGMTIYYAPTADVVEVKHGEWVYNVKYYSCSICAGKRFNLLLGTDAEYCPYCGAKMDGGKTE